jgi:hypothetical protein
MHQPQNPDQAGSTTPTGVIPDTETADAGQSGGGASSSPPPPPDSAPIDNPRVEPIQGVKVSVDPPKPPSKPRGSWGGARKGAGRKPSVETAPPLPTSHGAPEPPFSGGPPGTTAPSATPSGTPVSKATEMADPSKVAKLLTAVLDSAATEVAKLRYVDADGKPLTLPDGTPLYQLASATDEAKKDIQDAIVVYLAAYSVKMTPGQALVLAVGAAYVPKALALEKARSTLLRAPAL